MIIFAGPVILVNNIGIHAIVVLAVIVMYVYGYSFCLPGRERLPVSTRRPR